jgi:hypothetical protein
LLLIEWLKNEPVPTDFSLIRVANSATIAGPAVGPSANESATARFSSIGDGVVAASWL